MNKSIVTLHSTPLVGIKIKTSFERESNPSTSRIAPFWERYIREEVASGIPDRKNPGITYCVYLEYQDNDHMGEYSYFIGEEVTSVNSVSDNLEIVRIPEASFVKFTTPQGPIPQIIRNAWQEIWEMKSADLGGKRAFNIDFEIYDERAKDLQNAVVDIYLGVK